MTTADNAPDEQYLPEGQAPPSPESSGPETDADREREIQRRLTQQGRDLAEARRAAASANQVAAAQAAKIADLEGNLQLLGAHLSQREQREAAAQLEAELQSLPPADRLEKKIELLQGQINGMRTAVPPAQPARPAAAPTPPPAANASDEERAQYMERRVREIVGEAATEFGVQVSLDDIPDDAWNTEEDFYRSVMKQAAGSARSNGGDTLPRKTAAETPAQMRDRIRQEERERLGANSPTAPRATPAGRKKPATEADVRAQVQAYDSKLGPKANLKRLQELRSSMG